MSRRDLERSIASMFDAEQSVAFDLGKHLPRRSANDDKSTSSIGNKSSHRRKMNKSISLGSHRSKTFHLHGFVSGGQWTFARTNYSSTIGFGRGRSKFSRRIGRSSLERNDRSVRSADQSLENSFESESVVSSEQLSRVRRIRNSEDQFVGE